MSANTVSICVPTFNAGRHFRATLSSLRRQTRQDFELVVGDNGSTDGCLDTLGEFDFPRLKVLRHPRNLGYAGNCNAMIREASGEFVAIYHSDDVYDPRILELESARLARGDVAGVFTQARLIDEDDLPTSSEWIQPIPCEGGERILDLHAYLDLFLRVWTRPLICPTSMIRKDVYGALGGYDESLRLIEDLDMWCRILARERLCVIDGELVSYRQHTRQGSSFYGSKERTVVTPSIGYMEALLGSDPSLESLYRRDLDRLHAKELVLLARNALLRGDARDARELVARSLPLHRFPVWNRYGAFQSMVAVAGAGLTGFVLRRGRPGR